MSNQKNLYWIFCLKTFADLPFFFDSKPHQKVNHLQATIATHPISGCFSWWKILMKIHTRETKARTFLLIGSLLGQRNGGEVWHGKIFDWTNLTCRIFLWFPSVVRGNHCWHLDMSTKITTKTMTDGNIRKFNPRELLVTSLGEWFHDRLSHDSGGLNLFGANGWGVLWMEGDYQHLKMLSVWWLGVTITSVSLVNLIWIQVRWCWPLWWRNDGI